MICEVYVAGFLDADGSVSLSRDRKDSKEYQRFPQVCFYNCDRGILEAIREVWSGKIRKFDSKDRNNNVSYELSISDTAALNLLEDVYPYMIHKKKKQRAKLIIEGYKSSTPRNGKYSESQIENKLLLIKEVMNIKMRGEGAY